MPGQQLKVYARLIMISAIIAPSLLLVRGNVCAAADGAVPGVEKVAKTAGKDGKKRMALGVDNDGNVMVRYGRTSLTVIYGPEGTGEESRTGLRSAPPLKETAGLGEMSLKVSFAF